MDNLKLAIGTVILIGIIAGYTAYSDYQLNHSSKGGTIIETYHDHRLAMSAYVAGLICEKPLQINDFEWVNTSFPEFLGLMNNIIEE